MIIIIQLANQSLTGPILRVLATDFATYDAKGMKKPPNLLPHH